jgi:hypothetical protein
VLANLGIHDDLGDAINIPRLQAVATTNVRKAGGESSIK